MRDTSEYSRWCENVGIIPDSESREVWEYLQEKIVVLENALIKLSVGSCNCMTKTNEAKYHADTCPYRIIDEALSEASEL